MYGRPAVGVGWDVFLDKSADLGEIAIAVRDQRKLLLMPRASLVFEMDLRPSVSSPVRSLTATTRSGTNTLSLTSWYSKQTSLYVTAATGSTHVISYIPARVT